MKKGQEEGEEEEGGRDLLEVEIKEMLRDVRHEMAVKVLLSELVFRFHLFQSCDHFPAPEEVGDAMVLPLPEAATHHSLHERIPDEGVMLPPTKAIPQP
jgi:hypothetical protein